MNKTLKNIIYLIITAVACFAGANYCIKQGNEEGAWYFYILAAFGAYWIFKNRNKESGEKTEEQKERERRKNQGPRLPGR